MWNNVDEFAQWYKDNNHPFKPQAKDPIYITDHSHSTIIFRQDRFQVELTYCRPNWTTTDFSSPGIDQRILFLNGDLSGKKNGQLVFDTASVADKKNSDGTSILYNRIFKPSSQDIDVFEVGNKGACFMLLQYWEPGIPMTSIARQKKISHN